MKKGTPVFFASLCVIATAVVFLLPAWNRRESQNASLARVPIRKSPNGHILVRATVAGRPVLLMVDTGAAKALYLDEAFVRSAYLDTGAGRYQAYGLGGVAMEAAETEPLELKVGGVTTRLRAQALDLSAWSESWDSDARPVGILGSEFLSGNRVVIDYAAMRMSMGGATVVRRDCAGGDRDVG